MRVAGYIRVSTAEQALHGYSLEAQTRLIESFCEQHGHKLVGIYADDGKSASKQLQRRTELLRMLDDAEAGKVDLIAFKDLTRWSRNPSQFYAVQDRLDRAKVSWIAIEQPSLETVTAQGRLLVGITISVAAHESAQTADRVKFINASRVKDGGAICGKYYLPLGYTVAEKDGKKVVVIDEEQREMVSAIFDTYESSQKINHVIKMTLDRFGYRSNQSSVRAMLKNPIYKGEYHGVENYCEPYLTPERWEKIQRIRAQHHYTAPIKTHEYIFSSLLTCAECGGRMSGRYNAKGVPYYVCRRRTADGTCSHKHSIKEQFIEEALLSMIEPELDRLTMIAKETPKKKRSAAPLKAKLTRLNDLYIDGEISKEEYTKRKNDLQAQIDEIEQDPIQRAERIKSAFPAGWRELYDSAPKQAKNAAWRSVLDRIEVDDNFNIRPVFG